MLKSETRQFSDTCLEFIDENVNTRVVYATCRTDGEVKAWHGLLAEKYSELNVVKASTTKEFRELLLSGVCDFQILVTRLQFIGTIITSGVKTLPHTATLCISPCDSIEVTQLRHHAKDTLCMVYVQGRAESGVRTFNSPI